MIDCLLVGGSVTRQEDATLRQEWQLWRNFWALTLSLSLLSAASSTGVGSDHALGSGRDDSPELNRGSNPILQLGFEAWDGKAEEDFLSRPAEPLFQETDDWQVLPAGLMYKSYLAGEKEPRFSASWLNEKQRGLVWETQLGGRVGLIRYGTDDAINPEGWQFDVEGGAQTRVDPNQNSDLESADFRFGFLSTWRSGNVIRWAIVACVTGCWNGDFLRLCEGPIW